VVNTSPVVAESSAETTTSLAEASTLTSEATQIESIASESAQAESQVQSVVASRSYSVQEWLNVWGDQGGVTNFRNSPWTRWPLTYLNRWTGLQALDTQVTIYDAPGTFGYLDTAAHEGFHSLVGQYLPFITRAGNLTLGGVPIGAPVIYVEEVAAYSIGHIAAGRIFAVPLAPLEAFGSLPVGGTPVTLGAMAIGALFMLL
jgi:hypothetical protein